MRKAANAVWPPGSSDHVQQNKNRSKEVLKGGQRLQGRGGIAIEAYLALCRGVCVHRCARDPPNMQVFVPCVDVLA